MIIYLIRDNPFYKTLILFVHVRDVKTKMINCFELQDVDNAKMEK